MNVVARQSAGVEGHGNLAGAMIANCREPAKAAILHPGGVVTYEELFQAAANISSAVSSLGLADGDRVVLMLNDTPAFAECFVGLLMGGFIPVAVNPRLKSPGLAHILHDCGAKLLIADPDCVAFEVGWELGGDPAITIAIQDAWASSGKAAPGDGRYLRLSAMREGRSPIVCVPRGPDDVALLQYTSGTTGQPKGVKHLARGIVHCADAFARGALGLNANDVLYSTAKMFFGYGQGNSLLFPLLLGASSVLDPQWPSPGTVVGNLQRYKPTALFAVPALYASLLNDSGARRSGAFDGLRVLCSAGSPLPDAIHRSWHDVFGQEILDGIGATEVGHIFLSNTPGKSRSGATGKPLPGYEVRLKRQDGSGDSARGEPGMLWVRGPSVSSGYWGDAETTASKFHDGWYETADVFTEDADGYYCFQGRADDMFKVNSRWVAPAEIETLVLRSVREIREVALVAGRGAAGLVWPVLVATLRTSNADSGRIARTVWETLKGNTESYKHPVRIIFVDIMPTNENGKVLRSKISRRWGDLSTPASSYPSYHDMEETAMQSPLAQAPEAIGTPPIPGDSVGGGNFIDYLLKTTADPHRPVLFVSTPFRLPGGAETASLSLAQLDELAARLAGAYLRLGVRAKEPVALYFEEGAGYFVNYLALNRIGAIPAFVNSSMPPDIAAQFAARIRASLIVGDEEHLAALSSHSELLGGVRPFNVADLWLTGEADTGPRYLHHADDPVLLAHTSGTTGIPKAVQFNHYGFFYGVRKQLHKDMGSRALCALATSHASCISIIMSMTMRGGQVLLQTDRTPAVMLDAIESFRPELFAAFSKFFIDLCREDLDSRDLSPVSWWLSTGDASHEPHIRELVTYGSHTAKGRRVPGSMFIDNFGSSEFGFAVFRNIHSSKTNNYGRCIGKAFDWVDVALLDERGQPVPQGEVGLLGVRAPCVTSGYWNDSNMTQRMRLGGYWLTGDYAYLDADGTYYHVDRTPDRMVIAGKVFYSTEVEEKLLQHIAEVFDCTVVAVQSGEKHVLSLFVEPRAADTSLESIEERANALMAGLGYPPFDNVELQSAHAFVGVTGKKLKRSLREGQR